MRRRLLRGAVLLVLAACSPEDAGEIRVGVLPYLTGLRYTGSGRGTRDAALLAADEINAGGGILVNGRRRRLKLLLEDAGQLEEVTTRSARLLINQKQVIALIGPQFSSDAIPVAGLAEAVGLPMITPMATNPKVTKGRRWVFRMAYQDDFQGEVMARFARARLGAMRAAVLYDVSDDYGRGLAEVFRRHFEARGGRIVADERFTSDARSDFRPQLRRIRDAGAEVVFAPSYFSAVQPQLAQSRELGMRITFLGPDTWDPGFVARVAGMQETYVVSMWHPHINTPESVRFITRYTARFGRRPMAMEAFTYDAIMILADAIARAGTLDAEPLRAAIAATRHRGVTGDISFPGTGDAVRGAYIFQSTLKGLTLVEHVRP